MRDLHQAVRSLRRAPAFTLIASSTLALGLGSTVAASVYLDYLNDLHRSANSAGAALPTVA